MARQIFVGGKARAPSSLVAGCKKRATQPPAKRSSQTVKVISEQRLKGNRCSSYRITYYKEGRRCRERFRTEAQKRAQEVRKELGKGTVHIGTFTAKDYHVLVHREYRRHQDRRYELASMKKNTSRTKKQLPQGHPHAVPLREKKTTCPERRRRKRNSPPATTWGVKKFSTLTSCASRDYVIRMRNITLSVDEDSYRNVRIAAAHRGTSVSGLVRDFFRSLQAEKTDPDRQIEELFEVMDREGTPGRAGARERDRSKLYDR